MLHKQISRRTVLKSSAVATVPFVLPSRLWGAVTPSEKIKICIIGCGNRSSHLIRASLNGIPEMHISGICDIFAPRLKNVTDRFKANWNTYTLFEEMLEREKPDGVMIETTTHARAWLTIEVMKRGFDVYIEKPMCLTIEEGRAMVDAAKKYKRVTQVGTQQRSIPLNSWASDLVRNGKIGKIKAVLAPNFVGPQDWLDKPGQPMPDGGSGDWWDVWTNAACLRPYHKDLHYGWSRWSDYDAGGLSFGVSGWGTHSYDQVQCGLGTDDTTPTQIILEEKPAIRSTANKREDTITEDETGSGYYNRTRGLRAKVCMRYANGTELRLHLDSNRGPGLGCIFVGEDGKIEVNRDKISANPKTLLQRDDRPASLQSQGIYESTPHIKNWLEGIKTRKKCNADIEYAHRATTICNLVNVAREVGAVGKQLQWDPETELFTNNQGANENRWVKRPCREGWELVF